MGLILRTHMDTFRFLIRKLKINNYEDLMSLKREEIKKAADLKEYEIILKD